MAGIFVRGLTGNKVNVFVDGVRYSNGAQRGGVNTFLDLIDPSTLEGIEVLRGTSSAQYGSDALGGSVQFLSNVPALVVDRQADVQRHDARSAASRRTSAAFGNVSLGYARETLQPVRQRRRSARPATTGRAAATTRTPPSRASSACRRATFYPRRGCRTPASSRPARSCAPTGGRRRTSLVVANYLRTRQDGANRWDQMLGGDGNLIAELNDLQLDLAYVRVEKLQGGLVRPRVGHLLVQHAARGAREPGRQGQPERHDRARAGADDRPRRAVQPAASSCRRGSRCSSAATRTSRSSRRWRTTSTR